MSSRNFYLFFWVAACGALSACAASSPPPGSSPAPSPASPADPNVPQACNEMGCADGLVISLSPDAGWAPGQYRFTIVTDGETTVCEGALPLPPCEQPALRCTGSAAIIGESGCAIDPAAHGFSDIQISSKPKSVTLTIERDGQPIANQTLTPTYQRSQPNGPGCPPVCDNAHAQVAVAAR